MLILKVVFALFVYQNYCFGIYGFPQAFDKELNSEELRTTESVLTTEPDRNQTTESVLTTEPDRNQTTESVLTTEPDRNQTTESVLTTEPDRNQTTDDDNRTKPDEIQTTESALTTEPDRNPTTENSVCPPEKSLFSKTDIRSIIDFTFDGLVIHHSMIEHIVPQAKEINQKHAEDLNQFEMWFQNQPEHLIHVLEGLSAVRKETIEPEALKIAVILKDYPHAKENMDDKLLKFNKLSKTIYKYEKICKYMCEDQEPEPNHVFKRSVSEEEAKVCISIVDLQKQIVVELKENVDVFLNKTKDKLSIMDQTLTEKLEKFKIDLKDRALKEFGRTMYNVLNLEDEYHHFVKEMNSTSTQLLMYAVKDSGLQIDSKLLELQRLVEKYGDYCRNCNKGPVKRSVRHTKSLTNVNQNSIVHELIKQKFHESEMEFNNIVESTFKDLNQLIDDPAKKDNYLNNLKLKQKKIMEVENIERHGLEHLKSIASPDSVKQLQDVALLSEDLMKSIDNKITVLKKITP